MDSNSRKRSGTPLDPAVLHKKMLQLLSSLWVTRAVGSFARLGLADAMEDGAQDHAEIAAARGLLPDRVYRLLRALSTVGIVTEPARGRFSLTPLGRLLGSRAPDSTRTTAILLNDYFADMWMHLDDALAGGTAFEALKGRPFFDWLAEHPEEAERFNRMMLEVHGPETPAIVAAYDFRAFEHVVDIGGGNGSLLSAILAAYPTGARRCSTWRRRSPRPARRRRTAARRDFRRRRRVFESVPQGGDAYLIRHLLHDYDDDDCVYILAKVRRAMRPDSRVLVMEKPLPTDDSPGPAAGSICR